MCNLECVWEVRLRFPNARFAFALFFFFFLSWNIWLFLWTVYNMHRLQIYKFYFLTTFLLKIGPTILFTYLKIILLQYFSIFSFQLYPNGPLVVRGLGWTIDSNILGSIPIRNSSRLLNTRSWWVKLCIHSLLFRRGLKDLALVRFQKKEKNCENDSFFLNF